MEYIVGGYNTENNKTEYVRQIIYLVISIAIGITIWAIDYNTLNVLGYIGYAISVILLIVVLFTSRISGATSWLNIFGISYQPSEIMKLAYIMCFSKVLSIYSKENLNKKDKTMKIVIMTILFIIPFGLICLEPDFGTAIAFVVITAFIVFCSGIKYKYVMIILLIAIISLPIVYNFGLTAYQKERINVFLDPSLDPLGSGYNAIQSKLAVGSGEIFGTGFLKGTQTQYGYIPIKTSDFIFAVLSEEFGFVMSTAIIILFLCLIYRIVKIANSTNDIYAKYVCIGIAGMVFYHFVQNIGMSIGLMPITGVPLPFVSYGGSNLLTNMIAIFLVLNISARKNKSNIF